MRTGAVALAPFANAARKSNNCGHLRGFLALATFPSEPSTRAYARSPSSPCWLMSVRFNSSPSIDLTGYRHSATTEPRTSLVEYDIVQSPYALRCRLTLADCKWLWRVGAVRRVGPSAGVRIALT